MIYVGNTKLKPLLRSRGAKAWDGFELKPFKYVTALYRPAHGWRLFAIVGVGNEPVFVEGFRRLADAEIFLAIELDRRGLRDWAVKLGLVSKEEGNQ